MADKDEFVVTLDADKAADKAKKTKGKGEETSEKMFKIVIEEEEGALNYAVVGVNGNVFQIMRGVEVEVPECVLEVLEHSKATRLVKEIQPDGKAIYVPRDYATIPYRVLR